MGLESVTYISDLDGSNPPGGDPKSQGDDHIRNIKTGILNSFPNITGAVTATQAQINALSSMAGGGSVIDAFASGTKLLFPQSSAPTGWTQDNTFNDKVLRLIDNTGTGGATGGSWTLSGVSVDGHALATSEIPSHDHQQQASNASGSVLPMRFGTAGTGYHQVNATAEVTGGYAIDTLTAGGGGSHDHGVTSDAAWRPSYADSIVCAKT